MPTLNTKIIPITAEDRAVLHEIKPDSIIGLLPEPSNPVDPNAIAVVLVWLNGNLVMSRRLGYLPKDVAFSLKGRTLLGATKNAEHKTSITVKFEEPL